MYEGLYPVQITVGSAIIDLFVNPIFDESNERLGWVVEWNNVTGQIKIEEEIKKIIEEASTGLIENRIELSGLTNFNRKVSESINHLLSHFSLILENAGGLLASMSKGDLSGRLDGTYQGQVQMIQSAINHALDGIGSTLYNIKSSAQEIGNMAMEVSAASGDLSDRTQQQAASIEQTAASMEQLISTVSQSRERTHAASLITAEVVLEATESTKIIEAADHAIQSISRLSQKIGDITSIIDSIAFQTNLLALNAAVEAARAGEHGRGFAVVAGEVRALAQKSAESSKEITALIHETISKIDDGSNLVGQSGDAFRKLVEKVQKINQIVDEISRTSEEQNIGLNQISQAVNALDDVTQHNAALVEQLAATAANMSEHALNQSNRVSHFKFKSANTYSTNDKPEVPRLDAGVMEV